ncbi:UPF0160 -like [Chlorella sorokiniana]|uniref:UPF0160-like n=1 Tax=Chlorella sorokiniana TaxID=3076 RepID=A0A2P6U468_CHLSO|nr:UPF0160 -like [Chlorella sorokiniana]|eukprot:PRW61099.1 UPF0160 -like [Chlorella sorokiniana]
MALKIGTHSGSFHCDEALGCFLLQQTQRFAGAEVVRSRDPELLKTLDVVVDVGGVYDAEALRFDHHQRGFTEVFGHGFNTKLSSAGLVYKHFGREIVASAMQLPADHPDVQTVWLQVYRSFLEAVDAIDNGVNQWDSEAPPKYVNNTNLSARVGRLNPDWNEDASDEATMQRFKQAMQLTGSEFLEAVQYAAKSWLPARSHVKEALEQRLEVHPSGRVMKLNTFCPWKEHLYDLEAEMGISGQILYCLYEDDREKKWRIQAVGVAPGSFDSRKALPAAWRGLRDAELSAACGIPGGVFVHASGFIGGNNTLEGAVAMAAKALEME